MYSTRFGGSASEWAQAIQVDWTGAAYVGGTVTWGDFPVKDPIQAECSGPPGECFDAFVFKLSPSGPELVYSTFLGGGRSPLGADQAWDYGWALAIDAAGNAYLAGETYSTDFPVLNAAQPSYGGGYSDGFVVKIGASNRPPDCSGATASPSFIWPPNGKMISVSILGVTDPEGDAIALKVTGISQDEPGAAFSGIGSSVAQVKAERDGKGDGRVYRILFEAADPSGASCTGEVRVCVPHDQRSGCADSSTNIR